MQTLFGNTYTLNCNDLLTN